MSNGTWTDIENDLIVADYFAMLADDVSGRPYSKAEHRRALLPLLNNRSEGSIEFKHQNISAVDLAGAMGLKDALAHAHDCYGRQVLYLVRDAPDH
jgi:hypothetical protein